MSATNRKAAIEGLKRARQEVRAVGDKLDSLVFEINECMATQEKVLRSPYWKTIERVGKMNAKQLALVTKHLDELKADYAAMEEACK